MPLSEAEIAHLLYESDDGEVVGLDEVQLLEPPPIGRIPAVRELLEHDDPYVAFQAAVVLAAWGERTGLARIERFIDERVHETTEIAPHRIKDYDNVYDELAYAVHLFGLSGEQTDDRLRILRKLLRLYGVCAFESKLKYALLRSEMRELLGDVREALERAWESRDEYLASQLLPVLARWDPEAAWALVPRFLEARDRTAVANVAEALASIDTPESRSLLERLAADPERAVATQAQESLEQLRS